VRGRIERDLARIVIGVGNDLRGDDAAGWETVRRLVPSPSLVLHEHGGDAPGLIGLWGPDDDVVIVDTVVSEDPPGTILEVDALAGKLPAAVSWATTHGAGVIEGIELARALGLLPRSLVVLGITAMQFELGAPMTEGVERAVAEVVRRLSGQGRARRDPSPGG
jgi:hydrogenase maturation protease